MFHKGIKIHWVHLFSIVILAVYFLLSKINFVNAFTKNNYLVTFLQLYLFGIIFAVLFLFIFSHEKFFPVARELEKEEQKKESKYLKKYKHHGKVLATFIIGAIGGPVFSSLTARLLLRNYAFKYLIVILANIPSTLFTVGLGHGFIKIFNF